MSDLALVVDNLGKKYRIGRERHVEKGLARVRQAAGAPFRWLAGQLRGPSEDEILWALRHVSFEVRHGEVLGIIGRNGAGKSTLLKILSRITEPSEGRAEIHGRVGSLLEIGTGMHPELTGRENIYMNGTVLGMRRHEINRQFDAIVDFSGISKFVDTPVKRYSSGMRVRLGFAIAAHLEPEILMIDEVLAVGDAEFQKRCLGKMDEVAKAGRTVLFVSHNMGAVEKLCCRGILLDNGKENMDGSINRVIEEYLRSHIEEEKAQIGQIPRAGDHGTLIRVVGVDVLNSGSKITSKINYGEPFSVRMRISAYINIRSADIQVRIEAINGVPIIHSRSSYNNNRYTFIVGETKIIVALYNDLVLFPGKYMLTLGVCGYDQVKQAVCFEVMPMTHYPDLSQYKGEWGYVRVVPDWLEMCDHE